VKAIELAGRLFQPDGETRLSINFMPNAVYEPSACIRTSLETARRVGFDPRRIMFEFTENERWTVRTWRGSSPNTSASASSRPSTISEPAMRA
jgi:EAL domain-containing protein (putative c-di-GMP-specific phosphodiesterase class I)